MTTSKLTQHTAHKRIVIKLGGSMLEQLEQAFFTSIQALQRDGYEVIISHGGGPDINEKLAKNDIRSEVIQGIRVTSKEALEIVQSTLVGQVNPKLVHQLNKAGIQAIGLNGFDGNLLTCTFLDQHTFEYVGKIEKVATDLLGTLCQMNIVPVVSCIGATPDGIALNINADTVASEIALAMNAESLLLVTDIDGIQIESKRQGFATPEQINGWIDEEHIYGGMIPKVQAALACLQAGIPSVQIVNQQLQGTTIQEAEALV